MTIPDCSICLSTFKDPVSIPCGHIYCTRCLADHVNAPDNDGHSSFCPTCRAVFTTVTPDLTYLPKKYHQHVVPAVRRVYLDSSANSDLKKKLSKADAKIKHLEKDHELLLKKCEQHMAAAHAHAAGERKALDRVTSLEGSLADSRNRFLEITAELDEVQSDHNEVLGKYQRLKRQYRDERKEFQECSSQPSTPVDQNDDSESRRDIRPLPRKSRTMGRPPLPHPKRPRLSAPADLCDLFRD